MGGGGAEEGKINICLVWDHRIGLGNNQANKNYNDVTVKLYISSDTWVAAAMAYPELTELPEMLHMVHCHGHPPQLGPVQP